MPSTYLRNFLFYSGIGLLVVAGFFSFIGTGALTASLVAYLLSFAFTGSNYAVIRKIGVKSHKRFYRIFLVSLVLRLALVLALFVVVLKVVEIHHIYFTVSFIISYIFHSVIEIIYLHKTLETETEI